MDGTGDFPKRLVEGQLSVVTYVCPAAADAGGDRAALPGRAAARRVRRRVLRRHVLQRAPRLHRPQGPAVGAGGERAVRRGDGLHRDLGARGGGGDARRARVRPASAGGARPPTEPPGTGYNRPPDANGGHPRRRRARRHARAPPGRPRARAPHRPRRRRRGQGARQGPGHPAVGAGGRLRHPRRGRRRRGARRRARRPGGRGRARADGGRRRRRTALAALVAKAKPRLVVVARARPAGASSTPSSARASPRTASRAARPSRSRRRSGGAWPRRSRSRPRAVALALLGLPPDVDRRAPRVGRRWAACPSSSSAPAALRQAVQEVAGRTPGPVALAAAARAGDRRPRRPAPLGAARAGPRRRRRSASAAPTLALPRRLGGWRVGESLEVALEPYERVALENAAEGRFHAAAPRGAPPALRLMAALTVDEAFALCEAARARALRELPGGPVRARRTSGRYVHALYAFARAADDFADEPHVRGHARGEARPVGGAAARRLRGRGRGPHLHRAARDRARASTSPSRCCSTCSPPSARTRVKHALRDLGRAARLLPALGRTRWAAWCCSSSATATPSSLPLSDAHLHRRSSSPTTGRTSRSTSRAAGIYVPRELLRPLRRQGVGPQRGRA